MYKVKSDFLNILQSRGLLNQATDLEGLDKKLQEGSVVGYLGADPTADSLHIGNLVTLCILKWFQQTGNKPVILIGGATGQIGDPSGRSSERPIMTADVFNQNVNGIKKSMEKFFTFGDGKNDAIIVNNYDWFKDINYINFLTKYGRYFSVNEMLKRDSVKLRLDREQSLSFLEFNYSIFQAYDFIELYKKHNVSLQFGGADQWGNIVSGVDLGKKLGLQLYGLTTPLLTDVNGVKFGKSMGNAIWLNEEKLSAFDYYQFWRNVDDRDVIKLLKIFTDLSLDEIEKLSKLKGQEINEAKKILAFEATKICRGEEEAKKVQTIAIDTFEKGLINENMKSFNISQPTNIVDILIAVDFAKSKSEARRFITSNAVKLGETKIIDFNFMLDKTLFDTNKQIILSYGKKNKVCITCK